MADGVDHIDIYADVGEEFNQVLVCLEQGLAQVPASIGIVGWAVGGGYAGLGVLAVVRCGGLCMRLIALFIWEGIGSSAL